MRPLNDRTQHFETEIKFPGVEVKLDDIDVNILDFWQQPVLPKGNDNYYWSWSISVSTDRAEDNDEEHDLLVCYINGDLFMKGQEFFIMKINTLHEYHLSPLKYKKAHEELYKMIARESVVHANDIIKARAIGTAWEGFKLDAPDEDELDELAPEWNKRGYIPKPKRSHFEPLGRKLSKEEMDAMLLKNKELVDWIDNFDLTPHSERSEEEMNGYYIKYGEWAVVNRQLWHFKLIARNQMAYMLDKMMVKMEKKLDETPDNYELHEVYDGMREDYLKLMNELKDEFAKN